MKGGSVLLDSCVMDKTFSEGHNEIMRINH